MEAIRKMEPTWEKVHGSKFRLMFRIMVSKKQRQEYYALVERKQQPLFDDNYDDTVCMDERHRKAMIAYVIDNPRRALLRKRLPEYLQRCLHVQIGNRSYGAFDGEAKIIL